VAQERGERQPNPESNRSALIAYAQTFLPCFDRYALQSLDGSYYCIQEAIALEVLKQHLYGQVTLGAHALNEKSQARWVCFDADDDEEWHGLWRLAHELAYEHVPIYLEPSRRGGHLWLFFSEPLSGTDALLGFCNVLRQMVLQKPYKGSVPCLILALIAFYNVGLVTFCAFGNVHKEPCVLLG
jgi:hypothetical protein